MVGLQNALQNQKVFKVTYDICSGEIYAKIGDDFDIKPVSGIISMWAPGLSVLRGRSGCDQRIIFKISVHPVIMFVFSQDFEISSDLKFVFLTSGACRRVDSSVDLRLCSS